VGSQPHEARWLPSFQDATWSERGTAVGQENYDTGLLTVAFSDVDATATTATAASGNFYIEITTVWEWTPDQTVAGGLSLMPTVPPAGFSLNDWLSSIPNVGQFILRGVRTTAQLASSWNRMQLNMGVRENRQHTSNRITYGEL